MGTETKLFLGVIGGTLLLIFGAGFLLSGKKGQTSSATSSALGAQAVSLETLIRPDSWGIGSESAKLTLVEFSDFQCPACKAAQPAVESILAKYGSKLRFYYRHFPLTNLHPFAMDAALAAEAAGKQGKEKFWAMHDLLFKKQPDFEKEKLAEYAKSLGLDKTKFLKDFESDEVRQKVLNDMADGNKVSVNSTPTFFLDGVRVDSYSSLDSLISSKL